MHVTFAPNGYLQIDDARITFRNFEGRGDTYNRAGDRNFSLIIPNQEIADALMNDKNEFGVGWNVKIKPPRDADDQPFMHMKVKVKFTDYGPTVYLNSNGNVVKLNEESISCLDNIEIDSVNLDIRPYEWEVNGRTGRTAYLQSMEVFQRIDRFAAKYGDGRRFGRDDEDEEETLPF